MSTSRAEGGKQGMRIASIWRIAGDDLELKPGLRRCTDPRRRDDVLRFLRGGGVVIGSPGLREDRLDPTREPSVPFGYLTDGAWVWPMELSYYLQQHGILPQDEFVEHMQGSGFVAAEPAASEVEAALRLLEG